MLLFILPRLGVLVLEDEVDLAKGQRSATFESESNDSTLSVEPHLSGPNMITYGEALENSSRCSDLSSLKSFR